MKHKQKTFASPSKNCEGEREKKESTAKLLVLHANTLNHSPGLILTMVMYFMSNQKMKVLNKMLLFQLQDDGIY